MSTVMVFNRLRPNAKRGLLVAMAAMLVAAALGLIALSAGRRGVADNEAATINGVPILRSTLKEYVVERAIADKQTDHPGADALKEQEINALDDLVVEELMTQNARSRGLEVSDQEVGERLALIKSQNFDNDQSKLERGVQEQGLDMESAKDRLRSSMLIDKLYQQIIGDATTVSDAEIERYYTDNQQAFAQPEARHLRHILTATESDASSVKSKLGGGQNFADLAKTVSQDVNTRESGGDLGWIYQGITAPAFDQAAFSLSSGEISQPVHTPSGWNIIKVEEIKPGGPPDFQEVKEDVRKSLIDERSQSAWANWLKQAREDSEIIFAPEYQSATNSEGLPPGHP